MAWGYRDRGSPGSGLRDRYGAPSRALLQDSGAALPHREEPDRDLRGRPARSRAGNGTQQSGREEGWTLGRAA